MINKIENSAKLEIIPGVWKPSDIAFITKIEWYEGLLMLTCLSQSKIGHKGWPDISGRFYNLNISFGHVSDLQLKFPSPGVHQISGFDIIDISDKGWEGINFEVEDYEGGSLSFKCQEIIIESVTVPA